MFFPEGTRSRDTRVHRFSDGAFRLAIKAQLPILPLAIDGTQDALPKHSWQFGRAEAIKLKVLPPISTTGLTADDTPALRERVRQQIIGELASWRNVLPETVDALASRKHKDSINTPTPAGS
jgi:1-acyl-sn-glycerol-3-phosphate acyltransferase